MQKKHICDLCNSSDLDTMYRLEEFNLGKCNSCGLVYRDTLFSDAESAQMYEEDYFTIEQKDFFFNREQQKKDIFRDRISRISSLLPGRGRMLDIGCAIGTSLHVARTLGWSAQGLEVSEYAADYARKNYDVNVKVGKFEEQNYPDGHFNAITMWDVVDHFEEPQKLLHKIRRVLAPGGLLVLQTAMEDSLLYSIAYGISWLTFGKIRFPVSRCHPIHHSNYYATKTLTMALEKAGFRVVKKEPSDLNPELINTNLPMKALLKATGIIARLVGKPLEVTFYAAVSDSRLQAILKDAPVVRSGHEIKSDAVSNRIKTFLKRWPWFYNFLREAIGPSHTLGSPYALRRRVNQLLDGPNHDAVVLNLGSGTSRIHPKIVNVDLFAFKNVDVVADICDMPFKDGTVDGIVCDSVMEHVANSRGVLGEMSRVLKPGGTLIVTVPFLYPYHSSPDDYFRWTEEGVRYALKEHGFTVDELGMRGGPMGSLQGVLMHIFAIAFSFGSKSLYFLLTQFFMALFSPLKILDVFFRLFPYSVEIASDIFVVARKNQ